MHEAVIFTLLIDITDCVLHQPARFNFKKTNYTAISHVLNSVDRINFMHDCVGVDDMWTKFLTYLKSLVKRYVPYKTNHKKDAFLNLLRNCIIKRMVYTGVYKTLVKSMRNMHHTCKM